MTIKKTLSLEKLEDSHLCEVLKLDIHSTGPQDQPIINTGNILRKVFRFKDPPSGQFRKRRREVTARKDPAMADSPVTPTPQNMAPRVSVRRPPRKTFDIRAAIKQQEMENDLPKPSISSTQISLCEEALKQLKQKMKSSSARSQVDREFDSLQAKRVRNYKALAQTTAAVAGINRTKNRYIDVLPYDSTRVVLETKDPGSTSSDYINASFVQDSVREPLPRYIATQGPLVTTINDFWTMVLQQQCPVIIMLTRIVDGKEGKCAHYFPIKARQSQTYGQICVTNKSLSSSQHSIARRIFEVQDMKIREPPLTVVHYEYLDWPDHFVPPTTRSVRELFRALYYFPPQAGPFLVHCSAGIGRTGTYCTIDHTLRRILAGDLAAVDIENTVQQFRLQRDGMVQTREQYRFCYEVVMQELQEYTSTQQRPEATVKIIAKASNVEHPPLI